MIALSTAWYPGRSASLPRTLRAGRKIGFRTFEIGVSGNPLDLGATLDALARDNLSVCSLHAVCSERPVPPGNLRGDWIAEPDDALRREGVDRLKETLDLARHLGARAVVLHGGTLPMPDAPAFQFELYRLIEKGNGPDGTQPVLDRLVGQRRQLAPPYLDALAASLGELCAAAPDVLLALENRYHICDLPHGDEFAELFDRVDAPNLRYWHDVGHAHVLDRIGFLDHLALLDRYADRLAGVHLHDIRGFQDHQPPGQGDFDFDTIKPELRPGVIRVMEMSPSLSTRAVRRGREHLRDRYGIE
jgi:sugar phosphate isomerase/epimerase